MLDSYQKYLPNKYPNFFLKKLEVHFWHFFEKRYHPVFLNSLANRPDQTATFQETATLRAQKNMLGSLEKSR